MIDCNVALGNWPFRRVFPRTAEQLTEVMARCGLTQAWVSSLEGIFHKDLQEVNRRLLEETEPYPQLTPVAVLNPDLPGGEHDVEQLQMAQVPGVRLFPNYHKYSLSDQNCRVLLESLPERTFVQIVVRIQDERHHHPACQVPPTDLQYLPELVATYPRLSFVVCNVHNSEIVGVMENAGATDNLWFEISHVEGVNGLADLIPVVGEKRLLLGTYMPLFYPESSLLKLAESDLTSDQLAGIKTENAVSILCGRRQP